MLFLLSHVWCWSSSSVDRNAKVWEVGTDVQIWNGTKPTCHNADTCSDELVSWSKHQLGLVGPPIHASTKVAIEASQETPDHPRECAQNSSNDHQNHWDEDDAQHSPDEQEGDEANKIRQDWDEIGSLRNLHKRRILIDESLNKLIRDSVSFLVCCSKARSILISAFLGGKELGCHVHGEDLLLLGFPLGCHQSLCLWEARILSQIFLDNVAERISVNVFLCHPLAFLCCSPLVHAGH